MLSWAPCGAPTMLSGPCRPTTSPVDGPDTAYGGRVDTPGEDPVATGTTLDAMGERSEAAA